jgi:hypothetical protein
MLPEEIVRGGGLEGHLRDGAGIVLSGGENESAADVDNGREALMVV